MSIESYLGLQDKLSALQELRTLICKEMYRLCILANIEPDTFDHNEFIQNSTHKRYPQVGYYSDLLSHSTKLVKIEEKIKELHAN